MKKYIFKFEEMAYSRNQIRSDIVSQTYNIYEHIIKLLLFSTDNYNKRIWIESSGKHIIAISQMKWSSNKKFLPQEDYFDYFFNKPLMISTKYNFDYLKSTVRDLLEDHNYDSIYTEYRDNIKKIPYDEWIIKIKDFFLDVSELISKGKLTKQVLGNKYLYYFSKE